MAAIQSELTVIVKAKDLCSYVMTATEKSPKRFRFTLVAKLQSYALNTIENLCRANEVYVKPGNAAAIERRLAYQRQAQDAMLVLKDIPAHEYMDNRKEKQELDDDE